MRLDKLSSFGPEPAAWVKLLRPIFRRFVQAFDGDPDIDFWSRVCHHQSFGSGPVYLSGWITAFSVWSIKGKWQGPPLALFEPPLPTYGYQNPVRVPSEYPEGSRLFVDGVLYPVLDFHNHIAVGFCDIDVKLEDNGEQFDCMMVAGHVACLVDGEDSDTVRPLPAWFMFVKGEQKEDLSSQVLNQVSQVEKATRLKTAKTGQSKVRRAWDRICSCFYP
jgi:hypothetical protein